jgi:hypothetical protein
MRAASSVPTFALALLREALALWGTFSWFTH